MRRTRPFRRASLVIVLLAGVTSVSLAAADPLDPSRYPRLVWHAERADGTVVSSRKPDGAVNPASVVKVATTLETLLVLGPDARFDTRFLAAGEVDGDGVLRGDLVAEGGGDPDFHLENAFLVALRLRDIGIVRVEGDLVIHPPFFLGWEGGSEKTLPDADDRFRQMGIRLRSALDSHRWPRTTQRAWGRFADERGIDRSGFPRLAVAGDVRVGEGPAVGRPLLVHRSKPVVDVLRRFNCWSNNDIERLESSIGPASTLEAGLREAWGEGAEGVRISSTSGLGENRMTPRQIVRLLRDLDGATRALGLDPRAVLPVAGCDPGTLRSFFPDLEAAGRAGAVVGKTGSLVYTDHGVSVFAGIARTASGDVYFAAAYPRAGRSMHWARSLQQRLVVDLIDAAGGPSPEACPPYPPGPEDGAAVFEADRDAAPVPASR